MDKARIYADAVSLARAAAEHFIMLAGEAIATWGRFAVARAGGSTPRSMYTLLATDELAARVDWSRVHIFWGDERCVPPHHADSNYRMAREALLDHVALLPNNVHRMRGEIEHEGLIVFTRYPQPGKTKTRLIPLLGAEGAAELQQTMTLHTLTMAEDLAHRRPVSVEVHFEGGNKHLMREIFGGRIRYVRQCQGDLGERMLHAFRRAFRRGMRKAIIVGTDCPGVTLEQIERAFDELEHRHLVLGPANDGGYYLIGLRKAIPQLFKDIPWGTGAVLKRTLEVAQDMDLSTVLLEPLDDVDRPEDLHVWEEAAGLMSEDSISVVIPALNEADHIVKTLESVQKASGVDVIVVDGGSTDETVRLAEACGVKVIVSPPGRARQMNTGAAEAAGDILLFLHADTALPQGFDRYIRQALAIPDTVAGAFRLRMDVDALGLRVIERLTNWRSRRLQMPYGDQGIFIRAERFHAMGGFPEIPIMEDFEFIKRLRRHGRILTAAIPVCTSSRRWKSLGVLRTTWINQAIILGYLAGVPPSRLARWYGRRRK